MRKKFIFIIFALFVFIPITLNAKTESVVIVKSGYYGKSGEKIYATYPGDYSAIFDAALEMYTGGNPTYNNNTLRYISPSDDNGQRNATWNGNKTNGYYYTDCNGFVALAIREATGLSGNFTFFGAGADTARNGAEDIFEKKYSNISRDELDQLIAFGEIQSGDIVGLRGTTTHIMIAGSDGTMIENKGGNPVIALRPFSDTAHYNDDGLTINVWRLKADATTNGDGTFDQKSDIPIEGNMYKVDKTEYNSYCLQPGKKYKNGQTYYLDATFDVSDCKSSNETFECGLAAIVNAANENKSATNETNSKDGLDTPKQYATTLIALRLWTGYKSKLVGDGWWKLAEEVALDSEVGDVSINVKEKIFQNSASSILALDYDYKTRPKSGGLIYSLVSNGQSILEEAFSLFKTANAGSLPVNDLGGVTPDTDTVNLNNGPKTITIKTKFKKVEEAKVELLEGNVTISNIIKSNSDGTIKFDVSSKGKCKEGTFKIKITPAKDDANPSAVKRYYPKDFLHYQIMLVVEKEEEVILEFNVECNVCEKDSCMDITNSLPTSCAAGECTLDGVWNEEGTSESIQGTIEDPSMATILATCDERKNSYDVSSKYLPGNSSQYCKLYCREEVVVTFVDKTTAIAGMYFKYDIKGNGANLTSNKLSMIIEKTKECATDIDYEAWKSAYESANNAVLRSFNNFVMWEAIYDDGNNKGKEHTSPVKSVTAIAPCTGACTTGGPWKVWVWDARNFNICKANSTKKEVKCTSTSGGAKDGTDNKTSSSKVQDGKCFSPPSCIDGKNCEDCSDEYVAKKYEAAKSAYENALRAREQLVADIFNCNLYEEKYMACDGKINCKVEIEGETKDITPKGLGKDSAKARIVTDYKGQSASSVNVEYEDENYGNTVEITSYIEVSKPTDTDYYSKPKEYTTSPAQCSRDLPTSEIENDEPLPYYSCTGTRTSATCSYGSLNPPKTEVADFLIEAKLEYWQSRNYSTQVYTGTVQPVACSSTQNCENLPSYIYPVSLDVENGCYWIKFNYNNLVDNSTRNKKIRFPDGTYECIYKVVNETIYFECGNDECTVICVGDDCDSVDPKKPCADNDPNCSTSLGFIYRSIDLTNVFPNNREYGSNWLNSASLITQIENIGNNIWNEDSEYSFTLTPSNIADIKKYNAKMENSNNGYLDTSIVCENGFENCKSTFLNNIKSYTRHSDLAGRNK